MGYVDLHCHYLPNVDDGVRTLEEGVELCQGLAALGYELVVATPHIRTAMFENRREDLEIAFRSFCDATQGASAMPKRALAAEHFFDDVFCELFLRGNALPYPGGTAALVEFPEQTMPLGAEPYFYEMNVRKVRPVLAHPERYTAFFRSSETLLPLLEVGTLPLLDVMSLVGKYGKYPQAAAERMLEEDLYFAACSDCHRPAHLDIVAHGIERLISLRGKDAATTLLNDNPRSIVERPA